MRALLLVLMAVFNAAWAETPSNKTVQVFRIGDELSYKKVGDLGHCTGFIHAGRLFTAAHCNHFRPFVLVDQAGRIFLDLKDKEKNYIRNEHGLLDMLTIELSEVELSVIAASDTRVEVSGVGIEGVGFPLFLRSLPATILGCEEYLDESRRIRYAFEEAVGDVHFGCSRSNQPEILNVGLVRHSEVKGMSGGPYLYNGQVLGILYHYDDPNEQTIHGVYKAMPFDPSQTLISESSARRSFQLDRKLLEEAKQPNKSIMDLEAALAQEPGAKSAYLGNVTALQRTSSGWIFDFKSNSRIELESAKLSSSLEKLLTETEQKESLRQN